MTQLVRELAPHKFSGQIVETTSLGAPWTLGTCRRCMATYAMPANFGRAAFHGWRARSAKSPAGPFFV